MNTRPTAEQVAAARDAFGVLLRVSPFKSARDAIRSILAELDAVTADLAEALKDRDRYLSELEPMEEKVDQYADERNAARRELAEARAAIRALAGLLDNASSPLPSWHEASDAALELPPVKVAMEARYDL